MSRGNEFAVFFGLTLDYNKYVYTCANTKRHHTSADVYSQENKTYTPSTVIPPGQPIRILGGWMSITMNWSKGKHNRLSTSELKYIIRSVVASQALYYLNFIPLVSFRQTTGNKADGGQRNGVAAVL